MASRSNDSLSEIVAAVEELRARLEDAAILHDVAVSADDAPDNGRFGAIAALSAVYNFVRVIDPSRPPRLGVPLRRLQLALEGARDGKSHPLLALAKVGERRKDNLEYDSLKAYAAVAMTLYMESDMPKEEAAKTVAAFLSKNDYRKAGGREDKRSITQHTVVGWRDRAKSKRPSEAWLAHRYQNLLAALSDSDAPPQFKADCLLQKLLEMIPAKNPETPPS